MDRPLFVVLGGKYPGIRITIPQCVGESNPLPIIIKCHDSDNAAEIYTLQDIIFSELGTTANVLEIATLLIRHASNTTCILNCPGSFYAILHINNQNVRMIFTDYRRDILPVTSAKRSIHFRKRTTLCEAIVLLMCAGNKNVADKLIRRITEDSCSHKSNLTLHVVDAVETSGSSSSRSLSTLTSGRRKPHCRKCHQPMLGHSKRRCPPIKQPECDDEASSITTRMAALDLRYIGDSSSRVNEELKSSHDHGDGDINAPHSPQSSSATRTIVTQSNQLTTFQPSFGAAEYRSSTTSPALLEDLDVFRAELAKSTLLTSTHVFVMPVKDVSIVERCSEAENLHCQVLVPVNGDAADIGYVIVGEQADRVNHLHKMLSNQKGMAQSNYGRAVGVAVGAVAATWALLAYS